MRRPQNREQEGRMTNERRRHKLGRSRECHGKKAQSLTNASLGHILSRFLFFPLFAIDNSIIFLLLCSFFCSLSTFRPTYYFLCMYIVLFSFLLLIHKAKKKTNKTIVPWGHACSERRGKCRNVGGLQSDQAMKVCNRMSTHRRSLFYFSACARRLVER